MRAYREIRQALSEGEDQVDTPVAGYADVENRLIVAGNPKARHWRNTSHRGWVLVSGLEHFCPLRRKGGLRLVNSKDVL